MLKFDEWGNHFKLMYLSTKIVFELKNYKASSNS